MFKSANVPEVVPSSTKYGESPSDDRLEMMRRCCGRYETRMPTTMNAASEKVAVFGCTRWLHLGDGSSGILEDGSVSTTLWC
jgi:hypothetical protein